MAATETAFEAAMFPRMIEVVMRIVTAGVMAYPLSTVVYVRSIRMSFAVVEVTVLLGRTRVLYSGGTVPGDVLTSATNLRTAAAFVALCRG
jgi:hypothetical protein